jgi:uncharacterized protein (TIGR00255 family)
MIHSMTAYARQEFKQDWGTAVWEIRSVNQRYLETYTRLPEQFRGLEPLVREKLRPGCNGARWNAACASSPTWPTRDSCR